MGKKWPPHPTECPHCEYDREFPDFGRGGWLQLDNNGPIVSCPMCNSDGSYPQILDVPTEVE